VRDPPTPPPEPSPLGEPLLDARTIAEYLGVDTATIYRLAQSARLPSIEVAPRILRFRPDDVRDYLQRRTRKAPPPRRVNRLLGESA